MNGITEEPPEDKDKGGDVDVIVEGLKLSSKDIFLEEGGEASTLKIPNETSSKDEEGLGDLGKGEKMLVLESENKNKDEEEVKDKDIEELKNGEENEKKNESSKSSEMDTEEISVSEKKDDSPPPLNLDKMVEVDLVGDKPDEDKPKEKSETEPEGKENKNKKASGEDSSDEGENVGAGMIRIIDFSTIQEDVSDDSDDDCVLLSQPPKTKTIRVNYEDCAKEIHPFEMECKEEEPPDYQAVRQKNGFVRKQLIHLYNTLKNNGQGISVKGVGVGGPIRSGQGQQQVGSGQIIRPPLPQRSIPTVTVPPSTFTRFVSVNGTRMQVLSSSGPRGPINLLRPSGGTQGTAQMMGINNNNNNRRLIAPSGQGQGGGQLNNQNLNLGTTSQLIFDPSSGLIICPSNPTNNQQQQSGQGGGPTVTRLPGINSASELIAAMNRGSAMVSRVQNPNGTFTTRITTNNNSGPTRAPGQGVSPTYNYILQPTGGMAGLVSANNANYNANNQQLSTVSSMRGARPMTVARQTTPISSPRTSGPLRYSHPVPRMNSIRTPVLSPSVKNNSNNNLSSSKPQPTRYVQVLRKKDGGLSQMSTPSRGGITITPQTTPPSQIPPISRLLQQKKQNQSQTQKKGSSLQSPPVLTNSSWNSSKSSSGSLQNPQILHLQGQQQGSNVSFEEVTAGNMQGGNPSGGGVELNSKTFPSLVVNVRPCLQDKLTKVQLAASRTELDLKVKTILMYSPSKFTEWLMQKGLLRVDHTCVAHKGAYKLGMYSDGGKKQPFSGGYVWISDCCPDKQISVFQGSLFEASVYPPGTLMKLMYHWSCQTPAVSVLQWVKVTSYYLKNFYTLLRSACVAGLHEHCALMGGRNKYVEIGIITLGTTVAAAASSGGGQKQVKIEILGVFDPSSKVIRMKVINPLGSVGVSDVNSDRISQILWPLHHWVDKSSYVLIDGSMDKSLLEEMGFKYVNQSKGGGGKGTPTNVNVMNYLKNIVPKMFQNTLCVLSKSLIQQFLDEMSWREAWAASPSACFDTLLTHLLEMTKAEIGESLIARLNKISLNPFNEWSYSEKRGLTGFEKLPENIKKSGGGKGSNSRKTSSGASGSETLSALDNLGQLANAFMRNKADDDGSSSGGGGKKRKAGGEVTITPDMNKLYLTGAKLHILQSYYYVWQAGNNLSVQGAFPASGIKCPLCQKLISSNIEAMKHLIIHVLNVGRTTTSINVTVCPYCLKEMSPGMSLAVHVAENHRMTDITYPCLICCLKFARETDLVMHMWSHHVEAEAPYRCELCDFRSAFHYETVDHFKEKHAGLGCVQCPLCLKILFVSTAGDLKMVVVHLQNHLMKKGKKCKDCVLNYPNYNQYIMHFVHEDAHSSLSGKGGEFKRYKIIGEPIGMPKPPVISNKDRLPVAPPPPAKKQKTQGPKTGPPVKTLNSALSIPINPNEKFTYERFAMTLTDVVPGNRICWECNTDLTPQHLTGRMKCNKCRYTTSCPVGMTKHAKLHMSRVEQMKIGPQYSKPWRGIEDHSCSGCGLSFHHPDKLAHHLVACGEKTAIPSRVAGIGSEDESGDDKGPPVLEKEV